MTLPAKPFDRLPPPQFAQECDTALAIVIPAYKAAFLGRTLASIAAQTDRHFVVYVGDDASPHDLADICAGFAGAVALRYHRFDHNLGQRDLVAHWERCVALSGEPWVWVFGDDDVMEPGCVAAWRQRVGADAGRFDLYHFDVTEIDGDDRVLREEPPFPDVLPALEFALRRADYAIASYAPDYVFSRAAWRAAGGFVRFPLAWCTDDATWIALARRSGIRRVAGPRVRWRKSGQNISSARGGAVARRKLVAASAYVGWLHQHLRHQPPGAGEPGLAELRPRLLQWLRRQMYSLGTGFWPGAGLACGWNLRHVMPAGPLGGWVATLYWDLRWRLRGW